MAKTKLAKALEKKLERAFRKNGRLQEKLNIYRRAHAPGRCGNCGCAGQLRFPMSLCTQCVRRVIDEADRQDTEADLARAESDFEFRMMAKAQADRRRAHQVCRECGAKNVAPQEKGECPTRKSGLHDFETRWSEQPS